MSGHGQLQADQLAALYAVVKAERKNTGRGRGCTFDEARAYTGYGPGQFRKLLRGLVDEELLTPGRRPDTYTQHTNAAQIVRELDRLAEG